MKSTSEDSLDNIKEVIQKASSELNYNDTEIISILNEYLDDGTLSGSKPTQIKKISDSLLTTIRKKV